MVRIACPGSALASAALVLGAAACATARPANRLYSPASRIPSDCERPVAVVTNMSSRTYYLVEARRTYARRPESETIGRAEPGVTRIAVSVTPGASVYLQPGAPAPDEEMVRARRRRGDVSLRWECERPSS